MHAGQQLAFSPGVPSSVSCIQGDSCMLVDLCGKKPLPGVYVLAHTGLREHLYQGTHPPACLSDLYAHFDPRNSCAEPKPTLITAIPKDQRGVTLSHSQTWGYNLIHNITFHHLQMCVFQLQKPEEPRPRAPSNPT